MPPFSLGYFVCTKSRAGVNGSWSLFCYWISSTFLMISLTLSLPGVYILSVRSIVAASVPGITCTDATWSLNLEGGSTDGSPNMYGNIL
jgi:hypothetical protein